MMTVNLIQQRRKAHFTLVEFMFVVAIMGLITVALMNLYLFPFRIWQSNTVNYIMTMQSKIIREKILCGVDDDAGLRAAMMNSLHLSSEQSEQTDRLDYDMDIQFPPTLDKTNDDLNCALRFNPGVGLVFQSTPGSGQPVPLSRQVKDVRDLNFTLTDRLLTTQFTMQYTSPSNKTITMPVLIETYITNP